MAETKNIEIQALYLNSHLEAANLFIMFFKTVMFPEI